MRLLQPRLNLQFQQTDRLTVQHSWGKHLILGNLNELGVPTNDCFLDPALGLASSKSGSNIPIQYILKMLLCYRSSLFTL